MFIPMEKQETVQCLNEEVTSQVIDEEGTPCNNYMYPYNTLQSSDYVNYYDSTDYGLEEVKNEFPEDVCPQPVRSINSKMVFENEESSNLLGTQDIEHETQEEELSSIIKQEVDDINNQFIVKSEILEEHKVLDNVGDTRKHYDVLTTPQAIQFELCGTISQNSYNLLQHNNEHIKAEPPIQVDNEMNELHYCQCCNEYFNNFDNMLAHVRDAHSNIILFQHNNEHIKAAAPIQVDNEMNEFRKGQSCDEYFNSHDDMLAHVRDAHSTIKPNCILPQEGIKPYTESNIEEMTYKCESCDRIYKRQGFLRIHMERIHGDYGRVFPCRCGEQFTSPVQLNVHNDKHHRSSITIERCNGFQCDYCLKIFKVKAKLAKHIKYFHYDYGKTFECWCGKQFSTPMHLSTHKSYHNKLKVRNGNKPTLKTKFECDICHKSLKKQKYLNLHMRNSHYDNSKLFVCWCGQRFPTLINLCSHKKRQHGPSGGNAINSPIKTQFQCDICKKMFKTKACLKAHITSVHYEKGKIFECKCGKQFSTPTGLYGHRIRQHGGIIKNGINSATRAQFQCDICQKVFKRKIYLIVHMKRIHYDYGKTFECWCGKQFRTPNYLYQHKNNQHDANSKRRKNAAFENEFQCDICKKTFKRKCILKRHITSIHYDYGKTFECWCGKQFSTPMYLSKHKTRHRLAKVKKSINRALQGPVQCDICKKMFDKKSYVAKHIKRIHDNPGKIFECWCGKQFSMPTYLYRHKGRHRGIKY